MPYAANGQISQQPIAGVPNGGVAITEQQYQDALAAILDGEEVALVDDAMVLRPKPPSPGHSWENGEWTAPAPEPQPEPTIADVKNEAHRRIIAIMPEYKQRNTLATAQEAVLQHGLDPQSWPPELQTRHAEARAAWNEIERLRVKSDEIEAMDPIPADFRGDSYWAGD